MARPGTVSYLLSSAVAVTLAVGAHAQAQAPARPAARAWTVQRTPWGEPDLQAVWNYGTMTPLERPQQWAGKETLTETEAQAYEKQTIERRSQGNNTAGPDWWELQNNVLKNRRTSLVVDPPDGRIPPFTAEYQARQRAQTAGRGRGGRGGAYDGPENLSLQDRCIAWGAVGPPMQPTVYNNNVQIVQSPGYVLLYNEMIHSYRIVRMDGSPHGTAPSWYGDSRGRWDGDTLVVDTINFNGRLNFRATGETLHLIERFRRTAADALEYRYTVDVPAMWTKPWTVQLDMTKIEEPIYEFACHEGNSRSVIGRR